MHELLYPKDVIDPSTGTRIDTYEEHTESDVTEVLNRATEAFDDWCKRSIRDRERLLARAGEVLQDNKREYAETMTWEMSKPITQTIAEVEKCAWVCDHYAEYASTYLNLEHHPSPPGSKSKPTMNRLALFSQ